MDDALLERGILDNFLDRVICDDCLGVMRRMPDEFVHMAITSPPYNVGVGYDSHNDQMNYDDYLAWLGEVWEETKRVLVPGGRLAVNIAPTSIKNFRPVHYDVAAQLRDMGFVMRTEILWYKQSMSARRTAWGSWKSPRNPHVIPSWEYVLVFSKGSWTLEGDPHGVDITSDEFVRFSDGFWHIAAESQREGHPAPFPEELIERLIKFYTYRGNVVLDMFGGTGTVAVVAAKTQRRFIHIDISAEYCKITQRRLEEVLPMSFDLVGYKVLAERDVRREGPLITVPLLPVFPELLPVTSQQPVPSRPVYVTYTDAAGKSQTVQSRYSQQTRGGKRGGECWITGQLRRFLSQAAPNDILIIRRVRGYIDRFHFDLFKQGTPEYQAIMMEIGSGLRGPSGILNVAPDELIIPKPNEIAAEIETLKKKVLEPFQLEDPQVQRVETRHQRYVRDHGFTQLVCDQYQHRCAVCELGLLTPDEKYHEIQAAHIRPRSLLGPNHPRNGLALCRTHHWAFDYGVISVDSKKMTVLVAKYPSVRKTDSAVKALMDLAGKPILKPIAVEYTPASEAIEWHNDCVFLG